jgi:hypothetical protein
MDELANNKPSSFLHLLVLLNLSCNPFDKTRMSGNEHRSW